MPLSPQERRLRAQAAAHASHINRTGREATAAARAAALDKFEALVDPTGELPPVERARRARHARSEYFLQLSLKSARVRRARRGGESEGLTR
jgi:hypothetical protein